MGCTNHPRQLWALVPTPPIQSHCQDTTYVWHAVDLLKINSYLKVGLFQILQCRSMLNVTKVFFDNKVYLSQIWFFFSNVDFKFFNKNSLDKSNVDFCSNLISEECSCIPITVLQEIFLSDRVTMPLLNQSSLPIE